MDALPAIIARSPPNSVADDEAISRVTLTPSLSLKKGEGVLITDFPLLVEERIKVRSSLNKWRLKKGLMVNTGGGQMIKFKMVCALSYVLVGLVVHPIVGAEQLEQNTIGAKVRVGTFDSRAVAIAYGRSNAHRRHIEELTAEYEKAKATGDEKRVKELEAEGPAQQELLHKQGFSTWPVDNILEKIKGEMPEIAKHAGVDVIVCKWDIVYQRPGIEFIDITDVLVRQFDPDEETLKILRELQKQDPVPIEEFEKH